MTIVIDGIIGPIPARPRKLKLYVPPPKPRMHKYLVEVQRGGIDQSEEFPWWGPLDEEELVKELKEEGFKPIAFGY